MSDLSVLTFTVKENVIPDDVVRLTYVQGDLWVGLGSNGLEHPVRISFLNVALHRDFRPRGAGCFVRRDAPSP